MLLEAFSLIKNKAVTLKLIGKGVLKQELIKRSEELGISSRVDILDYKQNIENYYSKAKRLVSRYLRYAKLFITQLT